MSIKQNNKNTKSKFVKCSCENVDDVLHLKSEMSYINNCSLKVNEFAFMHEVPIFILPITS